MKKVAFLLMALLGTTSLIAQKTPKAVLQDQTLTFYYDEVEHPGTCYDVQDTNTFPLWHEVCQTVTRAVFDESFQDYKPTTLRSWFSGFWNLTEIIGMQYLNTSEVTNMSALFFDCGSLKTIDLNHFDTQKVTDMSDMFYLCGVKSLDLSSFDTRNVTKMNWMFASIGLETLDLSNFDTRNVTKMNSMFSQSSLKILNLSNFDTRNVTDIQQMFLNCTELEHVDCGSFTGENLREMMFVFQGCKSLRSVDLSNFDTKKFMFQMIEMFEGCTSLEYVDLSGLTSYDIIADRLFSGDSNLSKVFVSKGFVDTGSDMFKGCYSLSGDISYQEGYDNERYATWRGGYFTYSYATIAHLNEKGYATYSSNKNVKVRNGGKAYIAKVIDNEIVCQEIENIPAFTGVLLKGDPGDFVTFDEGAASSPLEDNDLHSTTTQTGLTEAMPTQGYTFVLSSDTFKKYTGKAFNSHRAYFHLDYDPTDLAEGARMRISFNDADGISSVAEDINLDRPAEVFNLNGTPASHTSGLQIVNGRIQFNK